MCDVHACIDTCIWVRLYEWWSDVIIHTKRNMEIWSYAMELGSARAMYAPSELNSAPILAWYCLVPGYHGSAADDQNIPGATLSENYRVDNSWINYWSGNMKSTILYNLSYTLPKFNRGSLKFVSIGQNRLDMGRLQGSCNRLRLRLPENIMITITITRFLDVIDITITITITC